METSSALQIEKISLFQGIQNFLSGTNVIFIKSFRSAWKRYGAFALYVAISYLLQLDNLKRISDNFPVFTSIAFKIGNPGLQWEPLSLLKLSDC